MSVWESLFLGFVQGATEFLPVSSSGHLVIAQVLMDVRVPGIVFETTVHLATLLAVLVVYRQRVAGLARGVLRVERAAWRYVALLALATLPAVAVGILLRESLLVLFERPVVPGSALLVTGALLWSTRPFLRSGEEGGEGGMATGWSPSADRAPPLEPLQALLMGVAQAFALVPGISRSGATVTVGLWLGVEAGEAAAFSFLMAVPAIAGVAFLELAPLMESGGGGVTTAILALGFLAAGVTGVVAIRTFLAMLKARAFHRFAWYCWLVGGAFLLYLVA